MSLAPLPGPPGRLRGMFDPGRLARYTAAGLASAAAHLSSLAALVELARLDPVVATAIGFAASVAVSYLLQHRWVFRAEVADRVAVPRFLAVVATGLAINVVTMAIGTRLLAGHYAAVQLVAFVLVPGVNYTLNSLWTFGAPPRGRREPTDGHASSER